MIQWYPGHMAKAFREIDEKIKFVDCILILLDARIPESSFNPDILKRCNNKKVIYCLNKVDLADSNKLSKWVNHYKKTGEVIQINSKDQKTKSIIIKTINNVLKEKREKDALKGIRKQSIKVMVVGIPNVGKSTLINTLVGKRIASIGNKPGVTKAQQVIKIDEGLELLDTPGVLWPKFEKDEIGYNLALIGSIKDEILPIEDVVKYGLNYLNDNYPSYLKLRYNLDYSDTFILDLIKSKNLYSSSKPDINRCCMLILNDLRSGSLGRITLEEYNNE